MPSALENPCDPKLGLAAEILRRRGNVRLRALGMSMLPTLWPGDLLTIQSTGCDDVAPGDIVLILRDHRFFVHRLVGWQSGPDCLLCITRGDAMPEDDVPVPACGLLGRVFHIRRGNRSFAPSRQVSPLDSAIARMLYRWDRFRSLALRIHAVLFDGIFFREVFAATPRIPRAQSGTIPS
jgi:Peptidase S24-like